MQVDGERACPRQRHDHPVDIKQSLRTVGATLRCSVGLAPNRYLSKIASDLCKPDGLTVFLLRDLPQALYCLKLSDLVGVGHAMERRIRGSGITTVEQLCQLTPEQMRHLWNSVIGERLWYWLRGADFHDPECKRKSLGKQHVLAPKYRTREQAFCVALKLLHISAANLRKLKMWAGGIGSVVEFLKKRPARFGYEDVDASAWKAHMRIHECRDTVILQQYLTKLWELCPAQEHCRSASGSSIWCRTNCTRSHCWRTTRSDTGSARSSMNWSSVMGRTPCTSAGFTPCSTQPRRESRSHPFLTWMTSDSRCRSHHCRSGHTAAGSHCPGNLPAGCSSQRLFRPNPGMKAGILSKGFVHHRIIPGVSEDSKSEDPLVSRGRASG